MTKELEPCPFCDEQPHVAKFRHNGKELDNVWFASCRSCNFSLIRKTEDEVVEAWNTRYKRTCHKTNEGDTLKCSNCGKFTTTRTASKRFKPRFCGSCGAEVVDDD